MIRRNLYREGFKCWRSQREKTLEARKEVQLSANFARQTLRPLRLNLSSSLSLHLFLNTRHIPVWPEATRRARYLEHCRSILQKCKRLYLSFKERIIKMDPRRVEAVKKRTTIVRLLFCMLGVWQTFL